MIQTAKNSLTTYAEIDQLSHICQHVLSLAKKFGASSAEVNAAIEDGFTVTERLGQLENIEYHRDRDVSITVYRGQSKGSVSTSDTSPEAIEAIVHKACRMAQYTEPDPCAGLAEASLMANEIPDLDLYHDSGLTPDQAVDQAIACENKARSLDARIVNSEGVAISSHKLFHVYGNSHGFIGGVPSTQYSINCSLIAEKNHHMERDGEYSIVRDYQDLKTVEQIAQQSVERAVNRLGARKISTRNAPVMFEARVASSLLALLINAISGSNLYRQSTFLLDHLNKRLFSSQPVRIYQQPFLLKGLGSAAFDSEGVGARQQDFVTEGVLTNYVLGSYSARKLGLQTTANAGGVQNLLIEPSHFTFEQLLHEMGTGLLVTELIGQGVNLVTGDYSRGAAGFWVENGKIQYPVSEITIAGNLRDMFNSFIAIGKDIDKNNNIQTGSILLENMTIAGE